MKRKMTQCVFLVGLRVQLSYLHREKLLLLPLGLSSQVQKIFLTVSEVCKDTPRTHCTTQWEKRPVESVLWVLTAIHVVTLVRWKCTVRWHPSQLKVAGSLFQKTQIPDQYCVCLEEILVHFLFITTTALFKYLSFLKETGFLPLLAGKTSDSILSLNQETRDMAVNTQENPPLNFFSHGMEQCVLGVSFHSFESAGKHVLWTSNWGLMAKEVFSFCESWIFVALNLEGKQTGSFLSIVITAMVKFWVIWRQQAGCYLLLGSHLTYSFI